MDLAEECLFGARITGIRLLLVDGDAETRASLRRGLEPRFVVTEAADAAGALACLAKRWFGVILADYCLADHDGVWLLEQVSDRYPHMRRVLMSSRAVPNVRGLRDAEILHLFFAKPLEPDVFTDYFVEQPSLSEP